MTIHTLIQPVITEKSMLNASKGVYTFRVGLSASKHQIKQAVETNFKVDVSKVNTIVTKPKTKRTGRRRITSSTTPTKTARVWLKEGQTIDLFEFKEK